MIAALIPIKRHSVGLPDKCLRLLNGKPLMSYSIQAALNAPGIDKVIVATESDEVAAIATQYGAEIVINPPELAAGAVSLIEVAEHVLNMRPEIATLTLLMATMPLLTSEDIQDCIDLFKDKQPLGVVAMAEVPTLFWRMAARLGEGSEVEWVLPTVGLRQCSRQEIVESEGRVYRPAGIWVVNRVTFFEYGSVYVPDMLAYIVPEERAVDINGEIDLAIAQCLLERRGRNEPTNSLWRSSTGPSKGECRHSLLGRLSWTI